MSALKDYHATLAAAWELLRSRDCYRQVQPRRKVRIVWWPKENIFPQRTDYRATLCARGSFLRNHPERKIIIAAVKAQDDCTLPWAPRCEVIDAADSAMFTEGDAFGIDMDVRREILVDVLHTVPLDISPKQVTALMRSRFQALGHQMTRKAAPHTYEQFRNAGWTDAQMRAEGYLV